ncbi:MAG: GNAT family N-acetyltransferase [Planctomycetota bacterium]
MRGVRGVGPRDLDRVVGLWSALMGHHEALDPHWRAGPGAEDERRRLLARLLADADAAVRVWDEEGDLLGFCAAQIEVASPMAAERARAEITDLFVCQDSRRRGIGRRLVEAVTDWIRERGVRRGARCKPRPPSSRCCHTPRAVGGIPEPRHARLPWGKARARLFRPDSPRGRGFAVRICAPKATYTARRQNDGERGCSSTRGWGRPCVSCDTISRW